MQAAGCRKRHSCCCCCGNCNGSVFIWIVRTHLSLIQTRFIFTRESSNGHRAVAIIEAVTATNSITPPLQLPYAFKQCYHPAPVWQPLPQALVNSVVEGSLAIIAETFIERSSSQICTYISVMCYLWENLYSPRNTPRL